MPRLHSKGFTTLAMSPLGLGGPAITAATIDVVLWLLGWMLEIPFSHIPVLGHRLSGELCLGISESKEPLEMFLIALIWGFCGVIFFFIKPLLAVLTIMTNGERHLLA